jgi:phosphoglycerate dehydrogenase-like enzyme
MRIRIPGLLNALIAGICMHNASAFASEPGLAATLARHRIQESPTPIRASPAWHAPRKILLLQLGQVFHHIDDFRRVAPGAQVIIAGTAAQASAAAVDADVIVGANPDICDPEILGQAAKLRWLVSLSAGVENCMQLPAVRSGQLVMTNMRGIDAPVIAEHAIAMMLALAHGLERFAVDTSQSNWNRVGAANQPMQFLEGKTLLVSGLGGIGTEVAQRAHGLGMTVVATRVGGTGKPEFVSHVGPPEELLKLAASADVIISTVPLTRATTGLYDARFFSVLKPTALFINVARGGSVVTDELVRALNEGRLAGAGLDVVDPEPLPADHPLWKAPHVLITPHTSARSDLPGEARWIVALENFRRYVAGDKLLNVVDLAEGY